MRSKLSLLLAAVVATALPLFASENRTQLIRHHITIPDGGSLEEILELSHTWRTRILERADNIGEVRYLLKMIEPDKRYELLVLYELVAESELPPGPKASRSA